MYDRSFTMTEWPAANQRKVGLKSVQGGYIEVKGGLGDPWEVKGTSGGQGEVMGDFGRLWQGQWWFGEIRYSLKWCIALLNSP